MLAPPAFPIQEDATGRRWRWRVPKARVAFSVALAVIGFALCVTGLVQLAAAPGAAGLLCLLPGSWASFYYYRIWRGHVPLANAEAFLEIEEVP